jgi:predicted DNA-binding WGR domain protein
MDAMHEIQPWKLETWQRPDGRFYCCSLQQNLFGEWVLIRRWGTAHSRRGRSMETFCKDYAAGLEQLKDVAKRRQYRGYQCRRPERSP